MPNNALFSVTPDRTSGKLRFIVQFNGREEYLAPAELKQLMHNCMRAYDTHILTESERMYQRRGRETLAQLHEMVKEDSK